MYKDQLLQEIKSLYGRLMLSKADNIQAEKEWNHGIEQGRQTYGT